MDLIRCFYWSVSHSSWSENDKHENHSGTVKRTVRQVDEYQKVNLGLWLCFHVVFEIVRRLMLSAGSRHDDPGPVCSGFVQFRCQLQQPNKVVDVVVIAVIHVGDRYFELDAGRLHAQHHTELFLPAHSIASHYSAGIAMAMPVSVTSRSSIEVVGRTELVFEWRLLQPVLHCVVRKFGYPWK